MVRTNQQEMLFLSDKSWHFRTRHRKGYIPSCRSFFKRYPLQVGVYEYVVQTEIRFSGVDKAGAHSLQVFRECRIPVESSSKGVISEEWPPLPVHSHSVTVLIPFKLNNFLHFLSEIANHNVKPTLRMALRFKYGALHVF